VRRRARRFCGRVRTTSAVATGRDQSRQQSSASGLQRVSGSLRLGGDVRSVGVVLRGRSDSLDGKTLAGGWRE
jgi:hypothetical protein